MLPIGVDTISSEKIPRFRNVVDALDALRPSSPVYVIIPSAFRAATGRFSQEFDGETMYAVKANHAPPILDQVYAAGVRRFDVASMGEVKAIHSRFQDAAMSFMAPIRLRDSARQAYHQYGIRDFALDSEEELHAILRETGAATSRQSAQELTLFVRADVPGHGALVSFSRKFGANVEQSCQLLKAIAAHGARPALTFHVGSQCMDPEAYSRALDICGKIIACADVKLAVLDIGGGFPSYYQNITTPPLESYFDAIRKGIRRLGLPSDTALRCEPGRALVADGISTIVQVVARRGHKLMINDGIFGSLNEYSLENWPARYPLRAFHASPDGSLVERREAKESFTVFGPTCDSLDVLRYPLDIPAEISAGDWIVFDKCGAYSCALRTTFNGFYPDIFVEAEST